VPDKFVYLSISYWGRICRCRSSRKSLEIEAGAGPASGITKAMPTMTVYDSGSVVLISFPFTSLDATKKRPAVVVSRRSYQEATHDIVLARRSRVKCMTNRGIC
jgi:hypothetical protein